MTTPPRDLYLSNGPFGTKLVCSMDRSKAGALHFLLIPNNDDTQVGDLQTQFIFLQVLTLWVISLKVTYNQVKLFMWDYFSWIECTFSQMQVFMSF